MSDNVIHVVVDHKVYHLHIYGMAPHWGIWCLELPGVTGLGKSIDAARHSAIRSIKALLAEHKEENADG